jgi:hypothetical protein
MNQALGGNAKCFFLGSTESASLFRLTTGGVERSAVIDLDVVPDRLFKLARGAMG